MGGWVGPSPGASGCTKVWCPVWCTGGCLVWGGWWVGACFGYPPNKRTQTRARTYPPTTPPTVHPRTQVMLGYSENHHARVACLLWGGGGCALKIPHVTPHFLHTQVMLGYSDSGKDAGRMAAAWALYKCQETLVQVRRALWEALLGGSAVDLCVCVVVGWGWGAGGRRVCITAGANGLWFALAVRVVLR